MLSSVFDFLCCLCTCTIFAVSLEQALTVNTTLGGGSRLRIYCETESHSFLPTHCQTAAVVFSEGRTTNLLVFNTQQNVCATLYFIGLSIILSLKLLLNLCCVGTMLTFFNIYKKQYRISLFYFILFFF